MSKVDSRLKTVFSIAITWIVLIACIMLFLHVHAQRKQAQRELIYIKARHEAEQIKQQRHMQYKKRFEEQKLKREVEKGYIVE